jgi:hypothetical protein
VEDAISAVTVEDAIAALPPAADTQARVSPQPVAHVQAAQLAVAAEHTVAAARLVAAVAAVVERTVAAARLVAAVAAVVERTVAAADVANRLDAA